MFEPPVPPRPEPRRSFPHGSLIERGRERWDDPRVRVGALLVAALVAGFAWYQLGARGGRDASVGTTTASTSAPATSTGETAAATGTSEPQGFVMVHVAGAVARPGLVRVRAGARVNDAIDAAGGGVLGADLDRLNLAAKVVDGQRVAVGLVGAPAPVETGATGATGSGGEATAGPININTASAIELEELPGIGPSLAGAIVAEREKRGGFQAVGELQDVRGIGELRYADIKDLVSV